MDNTEQLRIAVQDAMNANWHKAHNTVQDYSGCVNNCNIANWIHAVLHKIEGDEWNSKYWYAKTDGKNYEDFSDAQKELIAIQNSF